MQDPLGDEAVNDARVRSFADSTGMLVISRLGMAFGVPALLAMTVWALSSLNTMQIDIGILKTQVAAGLEDRYHASDAVKDFALRDTRIQQNKEDIAALKMRLDALYRQRGVTPP